MGGRVGRVGDGSREVAVKAGDGRRRRGDAELGGFVGELGIELVFRLVGGQAQDLDAEAGIAELGQKACVVHGLEAGRGPGAGSTVGEGLSSTAG